MKILFINHSSNFIYGGTKSLVQMLNNLYKEIEYDLVLPKSLKTIDETQNIEDFIKKRPGKLFRCWLPYKKCYLSHKSMSLKGKVATSIQTAMYYLNKTKINSLIMYPIVDNKNRYFIHIREIFEGDHREYRHILKKLKNAVGVIFIDTGTEKPFIGKLKNYIVLNNPFDMSGVIDIDENLVEDELGIKTKDKIVFSVIGMITEGKGIEFIIKVFMKINNPDLLLLIVGNEKNKYAQNCIKNAKRDKRIKFIGEIKDINKIYKITDCVLRGDEKFGIGRTIYEGLYSGCNVILPGDKNKDTIFDEELFLNRVGFYSPRDEEELFLKINMFAFKVRERSCKSNIDKYLKGWSNYVYSIE